MPCYILYTSEGRTLAPDGITDVENCQILGIIQATDSSAARARLLAENPWITALGFSPDCILSLLLASEKE